MASIVIFSVLAYATVYGKNLSDEADFAFIQGEGEVLRSLGLVHTRQQRELAAAQPEQIPAASPARVQQQAQRFSGALE